ncbi:MAG: ABC transporter ATP-binding protein [Gemmatimonadetes bacterium]|nr:ABC transporter ATP-binding protein [Gemmatimonadota bacterium]
MKADERGGGIGRSWARYRTLGAYARPHRMTFVSAGVLTLVVILGELLRPWPTKIVLDQVILGQPWPVLPPALQGSDGRLRLLAVSCAALLLIAGLAGLADYARTVRIAQAGNRIVSTLRADLHARLVRMSLSFHSAHAKGDLLVRLTGDAAMLKMLLLEGLVLLAQELLLIVGVATVAFYLNARLTAVAVITMPVVVGIVYVYGQRIRGAARKQRRKEGKIAVTAAESLQAIPEIQAYGLEAQAGAAFGKHSHRSAKAAVAATRLESQMGRATDVAIALGTAVVLWVGAQQVLRGSLTPGEMLVFVSYVRALFKPLRRVTTLAAKMAKSAAGAERLLEILASEPDLRDPIPAPAPVTLRGDLRLSHVSYAYADDGPDVLHDVDLHIRAGEHVAILGTNGAGKSTLASLIPRLRDVRTGQVLIDGRDVRSLTLANLRAQVAMVFQRTVLFDGTVAENVAFGAPGVEPDRLADALTLSGVSESVRDLPLGADTRVGEVGDALSGGQRQRVALARALIRDAAIVVFDEPTSALDPAGVRRLVDRVLPALRGRTVLLVTHDHRLARAVDRAVVLERGRVAFDGTPEGAARWMERRRATSELQVVGVGS